MQKNNRQLQGPGIIRRMVDPREWRWKLLESGNKRPSKVYTTPQEAEKRVRDAYLALVLRRCGFVSLKAVEEELDKVREAALDSPEHSKLVEQNEALKLEALSWMDRKYLGDAVFGRMEETPPTLLTFVSTYVPFVSNLNGAYHLGTNCIHTDAGLFRSLEETDVRIVQISHELHHYASWLGGGLGVRWRDNEGSPHFRMGLPQLIRSVKNEPFNEALTIFLSKKAAYDRGIYWSEEGTDQARLILGLMLDSIASEEEVRKAYFSGDFSTVYTSIEEKIGEGSFGCILQYLDESEWAIWGALKYIAEKIEEKRPEVGRYWEGKMGREVLDFPTGEHYIPGFGR